MGLFSPPVNPTNLVIRDSLLYLADGWGGFRVISISDPVRLKEVGYYQTAGGAWAIAYSEPYAYVTTETEGLVILEYLRPTSIGGGPPKVTTAPGSLDLSQNYPNPFNPLTTITYSLPGRESIPIELSVYDLRGRKVRALFDEERPRGQYSVQWDGRDEDGREVGSGVYLCRMSAGVWSSVRRMVVLR